MSSPLNSLAICAYAFLREQCDIVAALFEVLRLRIDSARSTRHSIDPPRSIGRRARMAFRAGTQGG